MVEPKLPESAQEIADVIGRERALYLIGCLPQCGRRKERVQIYVPAQLPADHQLVRILGWHDASRMARVFGGSILQPANCNYIYRRYRNASIQRMASKGMAVSTIASHVGLSQRRVRQLLSSDEVAA